MPDIFAVWNEEGWIEPGVEEQYDPDRTVLVLPLVKQAKKASEIAVWLNLSEARTRVLLNEMADDGIVGTIGKTKSRKYYLTQI